MQQYLSQVPSLFGLQTKVRDVKYCRDTLKLASLSADGFVKLWDPNLCLVQSVSAFASCPIAVPGMHDTAYIT